MGLFNSNLINTLSKCKNPWKAIGFSALGAFATATITYGVKTGWNYVTSLFQTKAAKDVEDYKAEKAQQTETEKAKEARATKEAQAQAQADAYERMREADAKLYREKMEIDLEKKQKMNELNKQQNASADVAEEFEVPYVSKVASFKESLENDKRELEWLVGKKIEVGGRCLVYGPSGVCKSFFSLQTAIAIAGGTQYGFLPSEEENQHEPQQVILIDLEMSAAEQKERTRGVTIPGNLLRNTEPIYNLDELFRMIEHESCGPKVTVIIDNIRKLEEEMSQTNQVNEYFSKLEQTQERLAAKGITVTFITITHTAKTFDMYKSVQLSDLAGGADLARFSTSVYALVPGREGNKVFKAVKQRNCASKDEVYILRFEEKPNLHLEFVRACKEDEALPVNPKAKGGKGKSNSNMPSGNAAKNAANKPKRQRLSDEEKKEIVRLYEQKIMKSPEIAKKFMIGLRTVQRTVKESRA